jgi:hypothetical protein
MFAHTVLVPYGFAFVTSDGIFQTFEHGPFVLDDTIQFLYALEQPQSCFTARMGLVVNERNGRGGERKEARSKGGGDEGRLGNDRRNVGDECSGCE